MKQKIGVLLVNLGTPDSPKRGDVARYLNEFLTDGRVIDIPWLSRQMLVRGIITPFRAGASAKIYKEVWDEKTGSPLLHYGQVTTPQVHQYLKENVNNDNVEFFVELAMRYQNPSIEKGLKVLQKKRVDKIVIFPLFPQYASATTGSIHQKVMEIVSKWWEIPDITFINNYFDYPKMIDIYAENGRKMDYQNYDHILFSFHGLPERQLRKGDICDHCLKTDDCCETFSEKNKFCYSAQCYGTAYAIAKNLGLKKEEYEICFQSRLGSDPWLQPYTSDVLEDLAKKGKKKVLVFCPAFVADCIETIIEIGVEYQEEFEDFGGEKVSLVPSLNDDERWVECMGEIVLEYAGIVQKKQMDITN